MARLKIKPLLIIYIFVCLYFNWTNIMFYYILTVILHEYGHKIVANWLGYKSGEIIFDVYGAGLKLNGVYKRKDDILISLGGPIVNVIIVLISITLWWIFPSMYLYTSELVICNLVILLFNLLPIYPLDGGRILVACLSAKYDKHKVIRISSRICFGLGLIMIVLFGLSLIWGVNFNLLFIGLFLAINSIVSDTGKCEERLRAINKKKGKVMEVKIFKVDSADKREVLRCISPVYYSLFLVDTKSGKKIKSEEDILLG